MDSWVCSCCVGVCAVWASSFTHTPKDIRHSRTVPSDLTLYWTLDNFNFTCQRLKNLWGLKDKLSSTSFESTIPSGAMGAFIAKMLLPTVSSLVFLPTASVAAKRGFHMEAMVYFFTMFFTAVRNCCCSLISMTWQAVSCVELWIGWCESG